MLRIAYMGPAGTFTEMALDEFATTGAFDGPVERISANSQPAALELVRSGSVAGAVVPIESSVAGSVSATVDALARGSRLQIVRETELPIDFTIATRPGLTLERVETVAAYPVAAMQVSEWLAEKLPEARLLPASSNAAAAHDVAEGHADTAVTTQLAATRLGLLIQDEGVADSPDAVTRFVLVTRPQVPPAPTGADRTSVVLELPNEPGALMRAFQQFAVRGIDLTRIESRPLRGAKGCYQFHLDCVGHVDDSAVAAALEALYRTGTVRFLGSWPQFVPTGAKPPQHDEAAAWLKGLRKGIAEQ